MDDIVDLRPFVPWNPVEEAARVLAATRTATVAARGAMAALASATKDAADSIAALDLHDREVEAR